MTLLNLREKVLQRLRVLAVGEEANPNDDALIQAKYEALYDMLATDGLVSWAVAADVPDYAALPLIDLLAYASASDFGIEGPEYEQLKREGAFHLSPREGGPSQAERLLRVQFAKNYVPFPAQPDYF